MPNTHCASCESTASRHQTSDGSSAQLKALFALSRRGVENVIIPLNKMTEEKRDINFGVYCVHSLTGAAGKDFIELARNLTTIPIYGIQAPPGKMRDSHFCESIEGIAQYYTAIIDAFQRTGPIIMCGWSVGCTIALEMSNCFHKIGRHVEALIVIDGELENTNATLSVVDARYVLEVARNIPRWIMYDPILGRTSFGVTLQRMMRRVVGRKKRESSSSRAATIPNKDSLGIARVVDISRYPEHQLLFMERLYQAALRYIPRSYDGRIIVFEATAKPLYKLPQVARAWRSIAQSARVIKINATHISIMKGNSISAVANEILRVAPARASSA